MPAAQGEQAGFGLDDPADSSATQQPLQPLVGCQDPKNPYCNALGGSGASFSPHTVDVVQHGTTDQSCSTTTGQQQCLRDIEGNTNAYFAYNNGSSTISPDGDAKCQQNVQTIMSFLHSGSDGKCTGMTVTCEAQTGYLNRMCGLAKRTMELTQANRWEAPK